MGQPHFLAQAEKSSKVKRIFSGILGAVVMGMSTGSFLRYLMEGNTLVNLS